MLRWGILGAGIIAKRFAKSLANFDKQKLVALSRRDVKVAEATAAELGCERAYASHQELLDDPDVDAIYLALPHGLHKEWALKTLESGKALLCEKPFTLSATDTAEVTEFARTKQLLCMEAMKCRFAPVYELVLDEVRSMGDVISIDCSLCNNLISMLEERPWHYMLDPESGGALLDCGIYCASWIEDFLPGIGTLTKLEQRSAFGVDSYTDACFDFNGVQARLECALDEQKVRRAIIELEGGRILVEDLHRPEHARIERKGEEPKLIEANFTTDDFAGEIEHFGKLWEAGATESDRMTLVDSIHAALLLDQIKEAAKSA